MKGTKRKSNKKYSYYRILSKVISVRSVCLTMITKQKIEI